MMTRDNGLVYWATLYNEWRLRRRA